MKQRAAGGWSAAWRSAHKVVAPLAQAGCAGLVERGDCSALASHRIRSPPREEDLELLRVVRHHGPPRLLL
eukprot:56967-Prymnesium_polylepis.2